MAVNGSIDGERRRNELVELVRDAGQISIEAACARYEVSSMTIRRDLEALEMEGLLRRVRGGAVKAPEPRSYDDRLATHTAAKRTIARKALALVPTRGAISLDASTTAHALAEMLGDRLHSADRGGAGGPDHGGLLVCTNSVQAFETLTRLGGVDPQLTGGSHEPVTGSLVGPLANAGAGLILTRVFFTSAEGLDPGAGTSEASLAEAEVKRRFASASDRTVLCADSSKLGKRSTGAALPLSDISVLITELDPTDARLDPYREFVEVQ